MYFFFANAFRLKHLISAHLLNPIANFSLIIRPLLPRSPTAKSLRPTVFAPKVAKTAIFTKFATLSGDSLNPPYAPIPPPPATIASGQRAKTSMTKDRQKLSPTPAKRNASNRIAFNKPLVWFSVATKRAPRSWFFFVA